jgi:MFS family permease
MSKTGKKQIIITRTVWILSLVSLLTDMASEMLYPVMPLYLKTIGFSVMLMGILEGVAEATAGLSKGYFGKMSDVSGRRLPFVQAGYAFSAVSKPMMAVMTFPLWIFFARTLDRLGKGIRTGARDAILSDESEPQTRGRVFGFHRSMDTIGAVLGPLLALLYLFFYPDDYKGLFYIAFIPGMLAVLLLLTLKEKKQPKEKVDKKVSFLSSVSYWKTSPASYKKLTAGLLIFALFNSSDMFLLLKAKGSGMDDKMVIGVYIFYNLVYAVFAFPVGMLADRVGLKKIFIAGLLLFSVVYFGMSVISNIFFIFFLFFLYGIYAAATEGIAKAWITLITDKKDSATAIGTFSGLQSVCALLASSLTGFVWFQFGATVAFCITALITFLLVMYFFLFIPEPSKKTKEGR